MNKDFFKKRSETADVVRTMAIILVVLCHLRYLPGVSKQFVVLTYYMNTGVDIFFSLSGFLITKLYLNKIYNFSSALNFYRNRWLRIIPLYLFFSVGYSTIHEEPFLIFLSFITFTQNYYNPLLWYVSWSLCVEEWFYILFVPVLLGSKRLTIDVKYIFLLLFLFGFCLRLYTYLSFDDLNQNIFQSKYYGLTHLRFDGLFIGCFFGSVSKGNALNSYKGIAYFFPLAILGIIWFPYLFHLTPTRLDLFSSVFQPAGISVLSSIWLYVCWNSEITYGKVFFESTSKISYALYLVHFPLIQLISLYSFSFWISALLVLVGSYTISLFSYNYFELFFLKFKS